MASSAHSGTRFTSTAAPSARTSPDPSELKELHLLCQQGRLYEVEAWVQAGWPLQVSPETVIRGRYRSALEIALETGQHSLCVLLFRNGYELDLDRTSPFDVALAKRRWDLIDLLFDFGADPTRVNLTTLFDTYRLELFDRFLEAGVDLTVGHALAEALAYHTGNKPLFGFVKRRRVEDPAIQKELNGVDDPDFSRETR